MWSSAFYYHKGAQSSSSTSFISSREQPARNSAGLHLENMALKVLSLFLKSIFFVYISIQAFAAFFSGKLVHCSPHFDSNEDLYLSSSIFPSDYNEMMQSFKIYIYPFKQQDFGSPDWCRNFTAKDLAKPAELFYETLAGSPFVTENPEEAHFYFLPFRTDLPVFKSASSLSRFLRRYIDEIKGEYPYWNQTLGADHFYVSCQGIEIDSTRNVVELKKNAIQISCFPLLSFQNSRFYAHKDITMPSVHFRPKFYQNLHISARTESYLGYFVGEFECFGPFLDQFQTDPRFRLDSTVPEPNLYAHRLVSSRFCLVFWGTYGNPSFLLDALSAGCIPVVISSRPLFDLPFQDVLDWKNFVLPLHISQLRELKNFLQQIPETQWQRMKKLARGASKHLLWHSEGEPYDTFYTLMYQLWLRRHCIRYARRQVN